MLGLGDRHRGALVAMAAGTAGTPSVSHLGFTMVGVFAMNPTDCEGGVDDQPRRRRSCSLVGIIYERRHTRLISEFGGLSKQMPIFATIFLIITMSSIGLPTLNGFIGELTILMGVVKIQTPFLWFSPIWWTALTASGIVLGAAYMLWLYQRTMFGGLDNPANQNLSDCSAREIGYLAPLLVLAFWIGLYPKPFFAVIDAPVQKLVQQLDGTYYTQGGGSAVSGATHVADAAPRAMSGRR
jgi:NADH-quinone oxidoreductase subunit M